MVYCENRLPEDIFLFGASCAPYAKSMDWPMEEWEKDLITMKSLHFNTVRIFAPWDRIEMEEGVFNYEKQDYFFDLAAKHGIRVILNFGGLFGNLCGLYPPRYLVDEKRCQERMESPASPPTQGYISVSFCPDDPVYRKKAFEFMERTVKRYAPRKELAAWMIWNEPASPFCYCPHTLSRFREYLKRKYEGSLEKLNSAWGTEFPVHFKAWEDIKAPRGSLAMHYDWVSFNQFRLYDAMDEITRLTEKWDPEKRPTTSNLVYHLAALEGPASSPRYGLDVGRVGKSLTLMGLSCYTVEHLYDPGPGYLTAYKLSRLRSASQDAKKRMLLLETGAGPHKRQLTEKERIQAFWQLIAHNTKSILLWNYRSRLSDSQVGLFHLMKWDGSVSERARYMGAFSKLLQDNASLINRVYPEKQAALLALEADQIRMEALCSLHAPSEYPELHDSRIGAYKLLWDMQIPGDCIMEENMEELPRYKLLLLPMTEHMTGNTARAIERFVWEGGTVIAESPFAFRDGEGKLQYRAPGFGLDKVFGCFTRDREVKETSPAIICPEGTSTAYLFWSEYELQGGRALAHYEGGAPAVVANSFGKGTAVVAGTEVFRQYVRDEQPAMIALLKKIVEASGAKPAAHLVGDSRGVEVSRLSGEGGLLLLVQNHEEGEKRFVLDTGELDTNWLRLDNGEPVPLPGEITLRGREVIALKARKCTG